MLEIALKTDGSSHDSIIVKAIRCAVTNIPCLSVVFVGKHFKLLLEPIMRHKRHLVVLVGNNQAFNDVLFAF